MTIRTADGLDVVLDEDHWQEHIIKHHPEVEAHRDLVLLALQGPDAISRSKREPGTKVYTKAYNDILIGSTLTDKITLRVYVRESSNFVVTAFFVAAAWRGVGEKIWPS
ncbi:MAG: hypothetical protein ACRD1R_09960 [Acidobacteriota bacterium]